jgi:hypothetical protein
MARHRHSGISPGILALATFAATSLGGCVSVGVVRAPASASDVSSSTSLEVRIYDSPGLKKAGVLSQRGRALDVLRSDEGRETLVDSFHSGTWSREGLEPGTYRLRLRRSPAASGPGVYEKDLELRPGEAARVEVILKKFPTTAVLVVAGVAAAGIGAAAAAGVGTVRVFGNGGNGKRAPKKCARPVALSPDAARDRPAPPEVPRPLPQP